MAGEDGENFAIINGRVLKQNDAIGQFVVDHIRPLCFGGADHPDNMAWQAVDQALKKDAFERDACGLLRRCHQ